MKINELTCNGVESPYGFSETNPVFSWKLTSSERGQYQTAYRIILALSIPDLMAEKNLIWDSGKNYSNRNFEIKYADQELTSNTNYYWRVLVWDKSDSTSDWSEIKSFYTGLLHQSDWNAKWICTFDTIDSPWLRKEFYLEKIPDQAVAYVNTIGFSELYINGTKISSDVLSPAAVDLSKRNFYTAYNIKSHLRKGKNVICIWLSTGNFSLQYYKKPMVRAQILLNSEANEISIKSDSTWKYKESCRKKIGNWTWNKMGGEIVDLRNSIPDWNATDYIDKKWQNCIISEIPVGNTEFQNCPPNWISQKFLCKEITKVGQDIYLLDFGTNLTGDIFFPFRNQNYGDTIHFYYSDACTKTPVLKGGQWDFGSKYINQHDMVISAGGRNESFSSKFNYHGFRYVLVTGLANFPIKDEIYARMIEQKLETVGAFECSDSLLNRINQVNLHTFRCLDLGGIYSDCPHRERLGYGDGQVAIESGIYNLNCRNYYNKWSSDWFLAQYTDGDLPHNAPTPYEGGGGPAWGGLAFDLAWKSYVYYGNIQALRQGYPVMKDYLHYLDTKCINDILKPFGRTGKLTKWDFLGDWLAPGRGMDTLNRPSGLANEFFNNAYRIYLIDLAAKTARALQYETDAIAFEHKKEYLHHRVHSHYYNPSTGNYVNNDQVNFLMALAVGITPDSLYPTVFRKLEESILVENAGHLNTGMNGTKVLLDFLAKNDRNDLVYTIVKQTTYPGWGYMIEKGATTFWEQWNGYYSNIHSCFTSIGGWFFNGVAGITQEENSIGFQQLVIKPYIPNELKWVNARFNSVSGEIQCNWEKNDSQLSLNISIPVNTTATIYLPLTEVRNIRESGKKIDEIPEINRISLTGKFTILKVGSGDYFFQLDKE